MNYVNAGRIGYGTLITRDTGGSVAVMYSKDVNPRAVEDTALFLASGNLYDVLARCAEYLGEPESGPGYPSVQTAIVNTLIRDVRAALKQARGEPSSPTGETPASQETSPTSSSSALIDTACISTPEK